MEWTLPDNLVDSTKNLVIVSLQSESKMTPGGTRCLHTRFDGHIHNNLGQNISEGHYVRTIDRKDENLFSLALCETCDDFASDLFFKYLL